MQCPPGESADMVARHERTDRYRLFAVGPVSEKVMSARARFTHCSIPRGRGFRGAVACPLQGESTRLARNVLGTRHGFPHEAVREWEGQLVPLLSAMVRKHRRGRSGPSWYTDETAAKGKDAGLPYTARLLGKGT